MAENDNICGKKLTAKKICVECGKPFEVIAERGYNRKIVCSQECKELREKRFETERYAKKKQTRYDRQLEKWEKPKPKKRYRKKYSGPSIAQIQIEARKQHMTYGQYVSKMGL